MFLVAFSGPENTRVAMNSNKVIKQNIKKILALMKMFYFLCLMYLLRFFLLGTSLGYGRRKDCSTGNRSALFGDRSDG